MVQMGFGIANIIGPQTFQAHDAPNYLPAKITIFVVEVVGAVVTVLAMLLYVFRNRSSSAYRAAKKAEIGTDEIIAFSDPDQTDRTNKAFRYVI
jgi:hypothetical protein